jgi:hypothetical protein
VARAQDLGGALRAVPGVTAVTVDVVCGLFVLGYDAHATSATVLHDALANLDGCGPRRRPPRSELLTRAGRWTPLLGRIARSVLIRH